MNALALLAVTIGGGQPTDPSPGPPSSAVPSAIIELAWEQKLDQKIPLDLSFRAEDGTSVRLDDLSGGRPIILVLAYYRCPQLCNLVLNGLLEGLRGVEFKPGQEFEVIVVSFDARETPEIARAKRDNYVASYARPGTEGHWHFLTGDEPAIAQLAAAVGFRYAFDAAHDRFNHASGITVLTPDGRVSRYLFGIQFPSRDLRLALVEASAGKVGSLTDQFLLYCFHYDAESGKYRFAIMTAMRLAATLTVGFLAAFTIRSWRRERKQKLYSRDAQSSERSEPTGV
jgi:protein SCO1/2